MQGLVWQPEWLRPHESFWSVLFKVAFASAVEPGALAEDWLGPNPLLRMAGTLPTEVGAYETCDRMGLPRSRALEMFCAFADGSLEQRWRFNMRLRWCPECAKTWFHSPVFQEWRRFRCPWHGVPLVTHCQACSRAFDLTSRATWKCGCPETSASERNWPRLFRAPVADVELAGEAGYLHSLPLVRSDGSLEIRLLQPTQRSDGLPWHRVPYLEGRWALQAMAFEEASSLLALVLGEHAECIRDEPWTPYRHRADQHFTFNCPVAAAAEWVAAITGCRTRHQIRFELMGMGTDPRVDRIMMAVTDGAPAWVYRLLVRDAVLALFEGALRFFLDSFAADPRRMGVWSEPGYDRCAWWLESPDVAVLKPKVTLASVATLVSSADAACPWTVLVPSSKQI